MKRASYAAGSPCGNRTILVGRGRRFVKYIRIAAGTIVTTGRFLSPVRSMVVRTV